MKAFLKFDVLITPKVLQYLYWFMVVVTLVSGVCTMWLTNLFLSIATTLFSLVGLRIGFELIMVTFMNNHYLRCLVEQTASRPEGDES